MTDDRILNESATTSFIESGRDDVVALDRIVTDASSALIGASVDQVNGVVQGLLQRIGDALDLNRITLLQSCAGSTMATRAFAWSRSPSIERTPPSKAPWADALMKHLAADDTSAVFGDINGAHLSTDGDGVKPLAAIPVVLSDRRVYALVAESSRGDHGWQDRPVELLRLLTELVAGALRRAAEEEPAHQPSTGADKSAVRMPRHSDKMPEWPMRGAEVIIGDSAPMRAVMERVRKVASTDVTVLLLGETGTGKELVARAIHAQSQRARFPLVSVNCAALPPSLIESELFGHERGAFTGAVAQRPGRFEMAHRGTIFLDEIGDLQMDLQGKLLRVLQERTFERVGSCHTQKVDVRVIAATHRDIPTEVADARFREDLYYRLCVYPIKLAALRERPEDILPLTWGIIRRRQGAFGRSIREVPREVADALQSYVWPGNVRELENVVERALISSRDDVLVLSEDDCETIVNTPVAKRTALSSVERTHIQTVLRDCNWRINGNGNAAERLGLHPNTLRFRMKKLGIVRAELIQASSGPSRGISAMSRRA